MRKAFLLSLYLSVLSLHSQAQSEKMLSYPKIRPDTLVKGYIDSDFRMQGMVIWRDTNQKVIRVETVKNDIPNGYYSNYQHYANGYSFEEGFYKDSKRDSLYFRYNNEDTTVSHIGFYRQGVRAGYFYDYYPGGQLAQERYYRGDSLVGHQIEYYPSGRIRSVSNPQKSFFTKFYDKDTLQEIIPETNDWVRFSNILNQTPPRFIFPTKLADSSITNQTSLLVDIIGSEKDVPPNGKEDIGCIFPSPGVYKKSAVTTIQMYPEGWIYQIRREGLYYCDSCSAKGNNKKQQSWYFGVNTVEYKDKNGQVKYDYDKESDIKLKSKLFKQIGKSPK